MRRRALAGGFGVGFGFLISWLGFTDPAFIHRMLVLQTTYPYLVMATCIALSLAGSLALGRLTPVRPQRRHLVGSAVFGLGWAAAGTCPGPIAAQLGQGFGWSLCTIVGVVIGVRLYFWREAAKAREAVEPSAASA